MAKQRWIGVPAVVLALACLTVPSSANPPAPGTTDPNQEFTVTPQAGTWMICVASYTGPEAPELARQLVQQLRSRDHLNAYVFNHADEDRKKLKEELDRRQKESTNPLLPVRKKTIRVEDQCAVLVGGYNDVESAKKTLELVKNKLEKPQLKLASGRPAYDVVFRPTEDGKGTKTEEVNPFKTAFVVRNPSLPSQNAVQKVDPLWWKLNRSESYSLLESKKNWTYVVKSYVGARAATSLNTPSNEGGFFDKLWADPDKKGVQLEKSAEQAHELARVLRLLNLDAYVLHTRTGSLVTVGAFDRPDDQEASRVFKQLKTLQDHMKKQQAGDCFQLYQNPAVMEVPRQPKGS